MNELDRDVLCVRSIWPTPKRQQTAAAKKTVGHFPARFCQPMSLAREEGF
jgi:hypothetical protein